MLNYILIGVALLLITVLIHGVGTSLWIRALGRRHAKARGVFGAWESTRILIWTVTLLLVLHVLEIIVWAVAFLRFVPGELDSFEEALYFSFVTFTTLGYGDITLSEGWRILSGIEALNGIMLVGWSTAMLFTVVQRLWQSTAENHPEKFGPTKARKQQ